MLFFLKDEVAGWIDRKGGQEYGLPIYRFDELDDELLHNNLIIIAVDEPNATLFIRQLTSLGLTENVDFFRFQEWTDRFKYIYALYRKGYVTAAFCGLQISNVCNLNCKGCLSFTHYIGSQHFYGEAYLASNAKNLFRNIDYIDMLEICGGEPFLVPDIEKYYTYIGENFRENVDVLSTVTNGTTIPSDSLCEILAKYKVKVFVDDYRNTVKEAEKNFESVYSKLKEYNVITEIRNVPNWINLGITEGEKGKERYALLKHAECSNNRLSLINNKLFYCDYECYADMAGVYSADVNDYLDISDITISKEQVLEFLLGYSTKGYSTMCRYCYGDGKINGHHINVAEQYSLTL